MLDNKHCSHHWHCEEPRGEVSRAECENCHKTMVFRNYITPRVYKQPKVIQKETDDYFLRYQAE